MSVTANFGSFFGQPVSNTRTNYAPAAYNMPATQPKPNYSPYPMMGGMQFPFAANGGATNLANSILGQGGWNSGLGLGQGTFVNPFGGYTMGKAPNMPNYSMAGLAGANNEVQILALLQKFLESQNLFAPEKPATPVKKDDTPVAKAPVLSGKGTIQGDSFKSGDGETYKLDLKEGQNYNLLSDKGEVETSRELRRSITEKEFEIERLKAFDYEEHNNIGKTSAKETDIDTELENNLDAWLDKEVSYSTGSGSIGAGKMSFTGDDGVMFDSVISKLKEGKIYNLFSDEGIQVGGRFAPNAAGKNIATEFGFYVDGRRVIVTKDENGVMKVNGGEPTAADIAAGITKNANGEIEVKSSSGGEDWSFTVGKGTAQDGLSLAIAGKEIGSNDTRTSGLWGELMGSRSSNAAAGLDDDGAGYIRNEFGELTSLKDADIASALATYVLSSYSDTDSGWSNYEGL